MKLFLRASRKKQHPNIKRHYNFNWNHVLWSGETTVIFSGDFCWKCLHTVQTSTSYNVTVNYRLMVDRSCFGAGDPQAFFNGTLMVSYMLLSTKIFLAKTWLPLPEG